MNKVIMTILIIAAILFIVKKSRTKSRIDMIDFLNAKVSNADGKWTQMSTDELGKVYKVMSLVTQSIRPTEQAYIEAMDVLKKYGVTTNSLVTV